MNAQTAARSVPAHAAQGLIACCAAAGALLACAKPARGAVLFPGDLVVVDAVAEDGGAVYRVDPVTRARSLIATGGEFDLPVAVALEPAGSILVLDLGPKGGQPQVIRVDPSGGAQSIVSFGGSLEAPAGMALGPANTLYVTDPGGFGGTGSVLRINLATGAQSVLATGGSLIDPSGIAVDGAGNLLVADYGDEGGSGSVVRVDPATGAQTVIARGQLVDPYAIAVGPDGTVVVSELGYADLAEPALLRLDPETGILVPLSTAGLLQDPLGVAFDAAGRVIVADADPDGGRLLRVDPTTGTQEVLFAGPTFSPFAVAVVVPEPAALSLACTGLLLALRRRRS